MLVLPCMLAYIISKSTIFLSAFRPFLVVFGFLTSVQDLASNKVQKDDKFL
jgi:hypothetical protein